MFGTVFDHQSLMEAYINKKLLGHADLGKEGIHRRRQTITHFIFSKFTTKDPRQRRKDHARLGWGRILSPAIDSKHQGLAGQGELRSAPADTSQSKKSRTYFHFRHQKIRALLLITKNNLVSHLFTQPITHAIHLLFVSGNSCNCW